MSPCVVCQVELCLACSAPATGACCLSRDTQGQAVGKLAFCWLPCGFLALKEESTVAAQGELWVHEGQRDLGIISLL